jgi:MoxR-like ATPase
VTIAAGDVEIVAKVAGRVRESIDRVIEGKSEVVTTAITVLLAEGHLLIEDVPGVGKTMLSKALARSIDSTVRRIQFTPDLNLGASPRATLHLIRAAKAYAGIHGRNYVLPDDVHMLARPVLAHRLLPSVEAAMSGRSIGSILDRIVASVPVPDAGSPT